MCNGGCSANGGGHGGGHGHSSGPHGPNPSFNVNTSPAPLMVVSYLNLSCVSCNTPLQFGTHCTPCAKKQLACQNVFIYNKICPQNSVSATIIGGLPPGTSVSING